MTTNTNPEEKPSNFPKSRPDAVAWSRADFPDELTSDFATMQKWSDAGVEVITYDMEALLARAARASGTRLPTVNSVADPFGPHGINPDLIGRWRTVPLAMGDGCVIMTDDRKHQIAYFSDYSTAQCLAAMHNAALDEIQDVPPGVKGFDVEVCRTIRHKLDQGTPLNYGESLLLQDLMLAMERAMQRDRARVSQAREKASVQVTVDDQSQPAANTANSAPVAGVHTRQEITITLRDGRVISVPRTTDGTTMSASRSDFESAYSTLNGSTPGGGWNDFDIPKGTYYEVDTQDAWELWQAAQFAAGT